MKLYRCLNEKHGPKGLEFTADPKTCRCECGRSWSDPEVAGVHLIELVVLHFDPPSGLPNRGKRHLACDPSIKVGSSDHRATGVASVVNCPACRESAAFKAAPADADPATDVPETPTGVV